MKKLNILFCILWVTAVNASEIAPAKLILSTAKSTYILGEPIPVSLTIQSENGVTGVEFREDLLRNFYGNFTVVNPQGKHLRRLTDQHYHVPPEPAWITIPRGDTIIKSVDLTDIYAQPYQPAFPHRFDQIGDYELTYRGYAAIRESESSDILWEGELTSLPLKITLVAPSDTDLQKASDIIIDPEAPSKSRLCAIDMIGYASDQSQTAIQSLKRGLQYADEEEKTRIVRIFGAFGEPEAFDAIATLLQKEQNPFVRAEAMAALGNFNTDEARRLLLAECETKRERSYRAAIVILGKIGDKSCIETLEDIEATDETGWVRERAKKSIESIKQRQKD